MTLRATVRLTSVLGAGALAVTGLAALPAAAEPVFVSADTSYTSAAYAQTFGGGCARGGAAVPDGATALVENGPTAQLATTVSESFTGPIAADTAEGTASLAGTARLRSAGGNLRSIAVTAQGGSTMDWPGEATSGCEHFVEAGLDVDTEALVAKPGFLTMTVAARGVDANIEVDQLEPPTSFDIDLDYDMIPVEETVRVPLTAGRWSIEVDVDSERGVNGTVQSRFDLEGVFTLSGSRLASSGRARTYVRTPPTRSCGNGSVRATISGPAAKAERVKQVALTVNGKRARTLRSPKAGQRVSLAAPAGARATVGTRVTLRPARKGAKPQVLTGTASYEGCVG